MRLPRGLREQPAWVFVGTLTIATGLSYLTGLASSSSIVRVMDPMWLKVWGGFELLSGVLVLFSTIKGDRALERLSLRFLSLGFLMYLAWVLTAVPLSRAMVTTVSCISLAGLAEIRIAVLKVVLRPAPILVERKADT